MKRVLILGGTGMLGHKLWQVSRERLDAWVTVRQPFSECRPWGVFDPARTIDRVDALRFGSVRQAIDRVRPDVVVNAIGIVKQAPEASDAVTSIAVNALFPHQVAALCAPSGARVVHLSTDCVFSGRVGEYRESDACDAEDLYGRSKALGELAGEGCLTLRTSMIGPELGRRRGLLEWCLSQRGGRVKGYRRAVFSGLPTLALADLIVRLIERHPGLSGVYHVSTDPIDKFRLLCLIRDGFGLELAIDPSDDVIVDRSLDSSRFRSEVGFELPGWPALVAAMAADAAPRGHAEAR